ncbi:hypothetical protein BMW24_003560 [Mycobacterium heckeshornense]|uniref:Uncharacterized protein n=1 Tax=Mycobacterium botniense TaxID=84962 RepID=A0A7I9XT64_9MYCO|nr:MULTISPECIES: hypothetical protein [Mycobacterium]PIJ36752.1 hypothetical protein BMW24_003275 [Mycobacterium heckeshornense]PIJ36803.1 hypothetical protein BMW24_003560 [Mycobacterium heckeshornense]GFG72710.1 hypothetical protein MBOT_00750 [Mycobacterium botniense]
MSDCQKCGRRAQLFLCQPCTDELRDLLRGLAQGQQLPSGRRAAGWLEYLADAAYGRTRLGASARRGSDRNGPVPVHLGPHGDWRGSPSELLDDAHATLARWVQAVNLAVETLAMPDEDDQL